MQMILGFFQNMNHVYLVEMFVILGIVFLLLFIFYSLGLIKIPK